MSFELLFSHYNHDNIRKRKQVYFTVCARSEVTLLMLFFGYQKSITVETDSN